MLLLTWSPADLACEEEQLSGGQLRPLLTGVLEYLYLVLAVRRGRAGHAGGPPGAGGNGGGTVRVAVVAVAGLEPGQGSLDGAGTQPQALQLLFILFIVMVIPARVG